MPVPSSVASDTVCSVPSVSSAIYFSSSVVLGGVSARSARSADRSTSDVQEAHVLRVLLDEVPAGLDVLTHQGGERLVGRCRVIHGDLPQGAGLRVHRGLPQLLIAHLAETL